MVMSDRIALLRMGELEQVASPREIYSRPATAYTAQFIGHTNLLRAEVRAGMARCNGVSWRVALPDGPALFSLRPESIRLATSISGSDMNLVRLRGKIQHQAFHGATELLQIACDDGLTLTVRAATRPENPQADVHLEFSPADAVRVRESAEKG